MTTLTMPRRASNRTYQALLELGFSTPTADTLCGNGWSVTRLKQETDASLGRIGLTALEIQALRDTSRPPIPTATAMQLLYDAAWTCCVCRLHENGVLIHHIESYAQSHSHDIENLVVVCPNCHAKAHTKSELTLNLGPTELKEFRQRWANDVRSRATQKHLAPTSPLAFPTWDYFNHRRLIEVANATGFRIQNMIEEHGLADGALVDSTGLPLRLSSCGSDPCPRYLYADDGGLQHGTSALYKFYAALTTELLQQCAWIDLTELWTKTQLSSLAGDGKLVLLKSQFTFKRKHPKDAVGPGQVRSGYRRAAKIELRFSVDAWECTSVSANWSHLSGRGIMTGIFLTRATEVSDGWLRISARCLALGNGMGPMGVKKSFEHLNRGGDLDEEAEEEAAFAGAGLG